MITDTVVPIESKEVQSSTGFFSTIYSVFGFGSNHTAQPSQEEDIPVANDTTNMMQESTEDTFIDGEDPIDLMLTSFIEYLVEQTEEPEGEVAEKNSKAELVKSIRNSCGGVRRSSSAVKQSNEAIRLITQTEYDEEGGTQWLTHIVGNLTNWLHSTNKVTTVNSSDSEMLVSVVAQENSENDTEDQTQTEEDFWSEWEWVLSKTEEFAIQQNQERSKLIEEELNSLRITANHIKKRPVFRSRAKQLIASLAEDDQAILKHTSLQASLRSKLLHDIVLEHSHGWLCFIIDTFFTDSIETSIDDLSLSELIQNTSDTRLVTFIEEFKEKPFAKNIEGALTSMSFVASHGAEQCLTGQVLGDILWSWWSTLCRSVRESLGVSELNMDQAQLLFDEIMQVGPAVASLWLDTARKSRASISLQGVLPELWEEQEKQEAARLQQMKRAGKVDAKWTEGPTEPKEEDHLSITAENLAAFRDKLARALYPAAFVTPERKR